MIIKSDPLEPNLVFASKDDGQEIDKIDEAFMAVGGFGKLQKFSYLMNSLASVVLAFFMYCLVFLEK